MKIKKEYSFSNKKQIWRILPTNTDKFVIEERDPELKEVFFSCIDIHSGKKFFNKILIEEKFWIGIEKVYKDIIFFHKFRKPDMPGHRGIVAFDIHKKEILWKNEELIFLFAYDNEVFSFKESSFGGENRKYYKLNYLTGEITSDLGDNPELNNLKDKIQEEEQNLEGYGFTKSFIPEAETNDKVKKILTEERNNNLISGKIDYIVHKNILLFSYHEILSNVNQLRNIFKAIDIDKGKVIFEEELNKGVKNFIPDSFFIKNDLLIVLKEKTELLVCSIKE